MTNKLLCWNCGASLENIPLPISRHANCEKCFEVLHCCRMCRHYEPEKRPYCDHERAEPPVEKESANFCDFFKPVNRFVAANGEKSGKARSDLAALFGDTADEEPGESDNDAARNALQDPDDPKNKLNNLFDD